MSGTVFAAGIVQIEESAASAVPLGHDTIGLSPIFRHGCHRCGFGIRVIPRPWCDELDAVRIFCAENVAGERSYRAAGFDIEVC